MILRRHFLIFHEKISIVLTTMITFSPSEFPPINWFSFETVDLSILKRERDLQTFQSAQRSWQCLNDSGLKKVTDTFQAVIQEPNNALERIVLKRSRFKHERSTVKITFWTTPLYLIHVYDEQYWELIVFISQKK